MTQLRKGRVRVGGNNKTGHDGSKLDRIGISDNEVDDDGDNEVVKKGRNLSKSKNLSKFKKTKLGFLTSGAKMAFTKLRQAFIKAPILYYFDPERHI